MKKFTNHTAGPKGINLEDGTTLWIEPGDTAEIDPDTILGKAPYLGRKSDAPAADTGELDALTVAVADLTKQVEALKGENGDLAKSNADLTKQVEALTKPADKK